MFLRISAVSRLEFGKQSVMDNEELLRFGLLTMTVSCLLKLSCIMIITVGIFAAMIIGFTERIRNVSEGEMPKAHAFHLQ